MYQEWQSYIISCQVNHDVGIEAAATGNKESDSSTDDSDEREEESSGDDVIEGSDFNLKKKAKTNNVCDWGHVIQCNYIVTAPNSHFVIAIGINPVPPPYLLLLISVSRGIVNWQRCIETYGENEICIR